MVINTIFVVDQPIDQPSNPVLVAVQEMEQLGSCLNGNADPSVNSRWSMVRLVVFKAGLARRFVDARGPVGTPELEDLLMSTLQIWYTYYTYLWYVSLRYTIPLVY